MQALARLLNVGRFRAKGYPAPMEWAFRGKLVKYAASGLDLPMQRRGRVCSLGDVIAAGGGRA